jgi:hypothetical protein
MWTAYQCFKTVAGIQKLSKDRLVPVGIQLDVLLWNMEKEHCPLLKAMGV